MNDPFLPQMGGLGALTLEQVTCLLQDSSEIDDRCVIQRFRSMGPYFSVISYFGNLDSFDRTSDLDMNEQKSWKISNVRWQTIATCLRDKTKEIMEKNRSLEEENILLNMRIQELESSNKRRKVE